MIASEPPATSPLPVLDRRTILKGGVLGGGLLGAPLSAHSFAHGFTHGVASGEPNADRVLLWTRYAAGQDTRLEWEVSETRDFTRPVSSGDVTASPARDWCCKAWANGLEPGRWYYYRFVAPNGETSDIGRTRTLPVGDVSRFRLGVFSCSNIGFGWFNAYAHAAQADDFDLAVHTGDYFYEYPEGSYPSDAQRVEGRVTLPKTETIALADYRLRYATYRADPDLRRLHQLYPMVAGWDDHESANDSYATGAENHDPATEGEWSVRKAAAMRVYREWLPVSDEPWAEYEIGNLATMFRLETRLTARDRQFSLRDILGGRKNPEEMEAALTAFRDGAYRDPARQLLGSEQQGWLAAGLRQSRSAGKVWQVLAQQVLMGQLATPPALADALPDNTPGFVRQRVLAGAMAGRAGLPLNMDAWDGYPVARERVLAASREADANLLVLAGDTHNAWAFELDHAGERAGIEFGGHSVTSPGLESYLGGLGARMAGLLVDANRQLKWTDTSHRGYFTLELTPERATAEYRFMAGVKTRSTALAGTRRIASMAGSHRLEMG